MKKKVMEKWTKMLESGKFKQAKHRLKKKKKNRKTKKVEYSHCCLGVLCELYNKEHKRKLDQQTEYDSDVKSEVVEFDGTSDVLPMKVRNWAGMNSNSGNLNPNSWSSQSLAELNDEGKKFTTISKIIKKNYETL